MLSFCSIPKRGESRDQPDGPASDGMSRPDLLKESVTTMFWLLSQPGGVARLRNAYRATGILFHAQDDYFLRRRNRGNAGCR